MVFFLHPREKAGHISPNIINSCVTAIINFLIMAFVVFLIVKSVNKLSETASKLGKKKEEEQAPTEPTTKVCPYCKSEIAIDATKCPHCTSDLAAE